MPKLPDSTYRRQAKAVWAFPVAGLVVGSLGCIAGWVALAAGIPAFASAAIVVAVLVAITGAMHEDGLADTVDGLWGGFTVERRLDIMKDSHIGTYGVLALVFSQILRISAISALLTSGPLIGVLAAAVFSRALMPVLMWALPNARGEGLSHKVGIPPYPAVYSGIGLAGIMVVVFLGWVAILPVVCAVVAAGLIAIVARAKINGQTGDILGATQSVSEIVFLLTVVATV